MDCSLPAREGDLDTVDVLLRHAAIGVGGCEGRHSGVDSRGFCIRCNDQQSAGKGRETVGTQDRLTWGIHMRAIAQLKHQENR